MKMNQNRSIKTPHYEAKCTPHSIIIKWNNRVDKYEEKSSTESRIYKYSAEEILFYYKNDIHYATENDHKILLKNVEGSIYSYMRYKKIVVIEDTSDPPDNVFIFPIEELLKSAADMNISDDRIKYHTISSSDWNSNIFSDSNYIYICTENELIKIKIKTNKVTRIS